VSEHKRPHNQRQQYTFEEDTSIVAQTVINVVLTTDNPHPFIVALLEGYAQRVRTMYAQPEMPDIKKSHH
jgi:hypothetical protein